MKPAPPTPTPQNPDEAIAIVEDMVAALERLRGAEASKDLRAAYQAAVDRLTALAYRLRQPRPRAVGLPPPQAAPVPEPAPEPPPGPPQRPLPLGPVVVARKPKRR